MDFCRNLVMVSRGFDATRMRCVCSDTYDELIVGYFDHDERCAMSSQVDVKEEM